MWFVRQMTFTLNVKMELEKTKLLHNGSRRLKRNDTRVERSCKALLVKHRMNKFWSIQGQVKMAQIMA